MYGVLSFLFPNEFTSKWRFADTWLTISSGYQGHKSIEGIKPGLEEDFYKMLSRYMIRRTKAECLPWLPAKQYVNLELEMTPGQGIQYQQFAEEAEIRIDEEELSATSVLAEYTRLKQFATAKQTILGRDTDGRVLVKPTDDSNKLPYVIDLLEERGIRPGEDDEGDEQVVIFSQFSSVTDMVCEKLQELGYPAEKLTGDVGPKEREALQRDFQAEGGLRIICMTTTAGGVAITLDRASTVVFLDETWDPDDQEQAEDRCHRGSRLHQVTIYYLRSKATIEQYIQQRVTDKSTVNRDILDLRRQGLRSV
jgi:SNF2 family DNA or RNA helicase